MTETGEMLLNLSPEAQVVVKDLALCVVACLLAARVPPFVWRLLGRYDIDRLVLPPGTRVARAEEPSLPAAVTCGLVGCTCVVLPVAAFASQAKLATAAARLTPFVVGGWTVLVAVGGAMLLARWFAQALREFLETPAMRARLGDRLSAPVGDVQTGARRLGEEDRGSDPVALFISKLAYFAVVVIGAVGAAEIVGLTNTSQLLSSGVSGTGRLALALAAVAAVLVGAKMAAPTASSAGENAPPQQPRTTPSIPVVGALLVGLFVLLGQDALILAIGVGAVVFFWQRYHGSLPDLLAGGYLRCSAGKIIQLPGGSVSRAQLGAVETLVNVEGKEARRLRNRDLLALHIRGETRAESTADSPPALPPGEAPEKSDGKTGEVQ